MEERSLKQVDIINMSLPYQKALNIKMSKSHLSQYVNGKSNPDQHKLYLLGKTLDVNEAWLMGFDVSQKRVPDEQRLSLDEKSIVDIYDSLSSVRKSNVLVYAKKQLEEQQSEHNNIVELPTPIVHGRSTAAGLPIDGDLEDLNASTLIVDKMTIPKDADEIVTIAGDSMEPTYKKGSQVFIRWQPNVEQGEVAIVSIEDEGVTCKKVYYDCEKNEITLRSINDIYEDRIFPIEQVRIIGKVL